MKAEEVRISEWEGYQRKDFKLDGHECILVMPKEVHPGKPWVWRAEFFGAFDYADRALLEKGWHIAYMMISDMYGAQGIHKPYGNVLSVYHRGRRP